MQRMYMTMSSDLLDIGSSSSTFRPLRPVSNPCSVCDPTLAEVHIPPPPAPRGPYPQRRYASVRLVTHLPTQPVDFPRLARVDLSSTTHFFLVTSPCRPACSSRKSEINNATQLPDFQHPMTIKFSTRHPISTPRVNCKSQIANPNAFRRLPPPFTAFLRLSLRPLVVTASYCPNRLWWSPLPAKCRQRRNLPQRTCNKEKTS